MLQARDGATDAVDRRWRDLGISRAGAEKTLLETYRQLDGKQPMIKVATNVDLHPRRPGDAAEALARVARVMPVQVVVRCPKGAKRRHCDQQHPVRLEQRQRMTQRPDRIGQVFEHVEHHDERIRLARLEARIERAHVDHAATATFVGDYCPVGFNAFDGSELSKSVEEESVSAADVQDGSAPSNARTAEGGQDEFLSGAPPPMALI